MTWQSPTITENQTMLPEDRKSTHPGEILLHEFLEPLGQTQKAPAKHLGVPVQRINELVRGKRGVTPQTAWLLSQAFDTSPEFWMNLHNNHDLSRVRPKKRIKRLVSLTGRCTRPAKCGLGPRWRAGELGR